MINLYSRGALRRFAILGLFLAPLVWGQKPALHIAEADGKRAATAKVAPVYPPAARQMRITGKVEVEAIVDAQGGVEDVAITTGNPLLTRAVVEAVKKWKFTPFTAEGKPARAAVALSFDFRQ